MTGRPCVAAALLLWAAASGCMGVDPRAADAPGSVLWAWDWRQPVARWELPAYLDEVSGLVDDGAGGLLSHSDNDSRLWRLHVDTALRAQPLSAPADPVDGDFEGVARIADALYLLTSPGVVYRTLLMPGGGGLSVPPTRSVDAAAGQCGFEGITADPSGVLYLACKYPRDPRPGHILLIRIGADGVSRPLPVDVSPVLAALGLRRLRPSGLTWLAGERLLVLAGKERVVLEVDPAGRVLAWRSLRRDLHRQAEGIALRPDGSVAIVDEADGRVATLTVYGPVPGRPHPDPGHRSGRSQRTAPWSR